MLNEPGPITYVPAVKTLRDEFAMAAMQGLISNPEYSISKEDIKKYGSGDAVTAHYAYHQADAMMKARGESNG